MKEALNRMHQRYPGSDAAQTIYRRASFRDSQISYLGHPRLLLRGTSGAQTGISLVVMAYKLKRIVNILGAVKLTGQLNPA